MSANNFLKITVRKDELTGYDDEFLVEDCDMNESSSGGILVGESTTLQGAIKIANDYMTENEVEYGLHIDTDVHTNE